MQAIAEKVGGAPVNNNEGAGDTKNRVKCRQPKKLDRDVDYATFVQFEKQWNSYAISDTLETLSDEQHTAILFSIFTKELHSDVEYWFKVNTDTDRKMEDVLKAMKEYLAGQRSMVLARYNVEHSLQAKK